MRDLFPTPRGSSELGPDELEARYAVAIERHVRANFVTTIDGAVELDGQSAGLSGDADRQVFMTLRALADVILVGRGTAEAEHYGWPRLAEHRRAGRRQRGQAELPTLVVVSGQAAMDPAAHLFQGPREEPRVLVVVCEAAPAGARQALAEVAEVLVCGGQQVDVGLMLDTLADRGLRHVLCEGGPTLLTSLLAAGRLDELCLTQAGLLAGPAHISLLSAVPRVADGPSYPLRAGLTQLLEGDGVLMGRYQVLPSGAA